MEWTAVRDEAIGCVVVTTRGQYNDRDHVRMIEDVISRPFWTPGSPALFDHRDLDLSGATLDDMRDASANHSVHAERIGKGPTALVMADALGFGTARQFEMLVASEEEELDFAVFLDFDAARAWLKRVIPRRGPAEP